MTLNENTSWMTIITCLLAVLFTVVGGVVTLVQVDTLSFDQYLERTGQLALAVSALGVGRSIRKGLIRGAGAQVAPSWLERAPVATITIGLMVLIAATIGGIVTIADPAKLTFADYLDKMNTFAFAVGIQGAGRALRKGIEARGAATTPQPAPYATLPAASSAVPDPVLAGLDVPTPPTFNGHGAGVAPGDLAEDEDLGADEEPAAVAGDGHHLPDLGEDALPTDDEEEASPPPPPTAAELDLTDVHALEDPADPPVRMPSQDPEPVA